MEFGDTGNAINVGACPHSIYREYHACCHHPNEFSLQEGRYAFRRSRDGMLLHPAGSILITFHGDKYF